MSLKISLRNGVWQIVGRVVTLGGNQIRIRESTGFTTRQKAHATEALGRVLRDALDGTLDKGKSVGNMTVGEAVKIYLNRPNPAGTTDQGVLHRFAKHHGALRLTSVQVADVMLYVNGRGNKASTVCRELNSIKAMFEYGRDQGLDIPILRLKKPLVDDSRCRWLYESERDEFINACEPEIKEMVTFLFFTGARLGEMFKLKWRDVVDNKAMLSSRKGVSRALRTRAVPLTQNVRDAIGTRGAHNKNVFTTSDNMEWRKDQLYPYFYRATGAVGITDFRPHDCRHTFASHLVQKGASLRAVADLLGHTSLSMVMRYAHLAPSHLEDTIELLRA